MRWRIHIAGGWLIRVGGSPIGVGVEGDTVD